MCNGRVQNRGGTILFTPTKPPAKWDYVAALTQIELTEQELAILCFQFSQPGRTMTIQALCGFDPVVVYGVEFCEVHHLQPVAKLKAKSKVTLDMLAIVCANCHRIIHGRRPEPYTLDHVQAMLHKHLAK